MDLLCIEKAVLQYKFETLSPKSFEEWKIKRLNHVQSLIISFHTTVELHSYGLMAMVMYRKKAMEFWERNLKDCT